MKIYFCEFIMWQRVAFAMTVVPLAIGGGVLALFCSWNALIGASSGAPARFATVMLGGMVLSTAAALTLLPVLIARIKE